MSRQTTTGSVTARRARTTGQLGAAVLLLLALGGCGSESGDAGDNGDTGGTANGGFDVSSATLTDEPFCDRVDPAVVGEVLGMAPDKVRTQVDRAVEEEFEGPDEEAPPVKSVSNLCVFGSNTSQFTVSVQPDASAEDVQRAIDELSALSGKESSEQCEPTDASAFGDPAGVFTCTSNPPIKRMRVVATGLVGDSKFYCAAMVNQGAGPELADATAEACRATMEELASA
jgi:hypothetical protein